MESTVMDNVELTSNADDDDEDSHLGSGVKRTAKVALPGWLKEFLQGLQPVLQTIADFLQSVYDIFTWRNENSYILFGALLASAAIFMVIPFWPFLLLVGEVLLLLFSPLTTAVSGTVIFIRCWRWVKPSGDNVMPVAEPPTTWFSNDYKRRWSISRTPSNS